MKNILILIGVAVLPLLMSCSEEQDQLISSQSTIGYVQYDEEEYNIYSITLVKEEAVHNTISRLYVLDTDLKDSLILNIRVEPEVESYNISYELLVSNLLIQMFYGNTQVFGNIIIEGEFNEFSIDLQGYVKEPEIIDFVIKTE